MKILKLIPIMLLFIVACDKKTEENVNNSTSVSDNWDKDNYFTIDNITYYRDIVNKFGVTTQVSCANNQYNWANLDNNNFLGNSLTIGQSSNQSIILIDVIRNNSKLSFICIKKPKLVSKIVNGSTSFEFNNLKFYENNTTDTSNIIYASGKFTCK